ncbi:MAG: 4Fe-4S binding protein [Clostridia bacterium]|nr:4Fe-4S binding protein [Clostridia bacterium]
MDNKKRTLIQAAAALLQNGHISGFFTGKIYTGAGKQFCLPGLNCYSCPGALGACPVGSLQNAISAWHFRFPSYVLGWLLFFGAAFGRLICGFLCPFGFVQDLLFKIPSPRKLRTFRCDRQLRSVKYGVLLITVLILPAAHHFTPFYCKYLCPSGTLSGLLLSAADGRLRALWGWIFTWKAIVLAAVVLASVVIFRPFCKYLCPLGAFYSLFNRVSAVRLHPDREKCTGCGLCAKVCDMAVNPAASPDDPECIRCFKCVSACPHGALCCTCFSKRAGAAGGSEKNEKNI